MIQVQEYKFFPERMIFVPNACNDILLEQIFNFYPKLDIEEENRNSLFLHNPENVKFNPENLTHIGFSLSKNCNLRCRYCSACSAEGDFTSVSNTDVLTFVSDIMKRWYIARTIGKEKTSELEIYFTGGGEPTYNWESFSSLILAIEEKANKNNIPIQLGITTNGVLDRNQAKFIAKHFHRIMVSYDGLPDIQNGNRKSPHFNETSSIVEETIKILCDEKAPVTIRTTVWFNDFFRMSEMADFLFGKFGCNFTWSILPVSPMGRAKHMYNNFSCEKDDSKYDFLSAFLNIKEYTKKYWPDSNVESQFFSASPSHIYCGSLSHMATCAWLNNNGEIITCIEADAFPTIVGNIIDGEVIYKETCVDPLLKKAQEMYDSCKQCFAYPFCKGGCPAKAIAKEQLNDDREMSWDCEMTVKFWKYLLNELVLGRESFGWKTENSRYHALSEIGVLECVPIKEKKRIF